MSFHDRLPRARQVAPVYAIIVLVLYSWTVTWFFWKLSSWIFYLNTAEILTILAYALTVNLGESLLVVLAPIGLSLLLPRTWFLGDFVARGTALVLPGLLFLVFVAFQFEGRDQWHQTLVMRLALPVAFLTLLLMMAVGKWPWLRSFLEGLSDRATIFLYVSIPASTVALLVVVVRNLA